MRRHPTHPRSLGNYDRLFNAASQRVRAWEAAELAKQAAEPALLPVSVE